MSESEEFQVVTPKIKGFICTTAHPLGCQRNVEQQLSIAKETMKPFDKYSKVLILGASSGFGLSSRVSLAVGAKASTMGVFFEREPKGKRTGSPGYYNSKAFAEYCAREGLYCKDFNTDGFSNETREIVAQAIAEDFGKIDLLIYSLAAPRRTHPDSGETFSSVLKPIGQTYHSKTVDLVKGVISDVEIAPASEEEIAGTVRVMGGDDWIRWIDFLKQKDLLAEGFDTVAFSYIGSELTYPIYKDGTIGAAKKDLEASVARINEALASLSGRALVSVNKALITQASSAIPVVPLYLSLLYKVMKEKSVHEDCIHQMVRLFNDFLTVPADELKVDEAGRIRIDDLELREDVQQEVLDLWKKVSESNLESLSDLKGVRSDYLKIFGFDHEEINYDQAVNIAV
jgi:enoyl-[acyl-carrier protein] reductase/trans-2-enoyl-CoA reductase (NAD+)